jgi:molybdopterin-guanine dinucleotide biosynthesis protein A
VPFVAGFFQPLAAAYEPTATLEAIARSSALGNHSLIRVLQILDEQVERLELAEEHARTLRDWDTPEDMHG